MLQFFHSGSPPHSANPIPRPSAQAGFNGQVKVKGQGNSQIKGLACGAPATPFGCVAISLTSVGPTVSRETKMHITEVSEVLALACALLAAGQLAELKATLTSAHVATRAQETAYEIWLEETAAAR